MIDEIVCSTAKQSIIELEVRAPTKTSSSLMQQEAKSSTVDLSGVVQTVAQEEVTQPVDLLTWGGGLKPGQRWADVSESEED